MTLRRKEKERLSVKTMVDQATAGMALRKKGSKNESTYLDLVVLQH